MNTATLRGTVEQVALTKALLRLLMGDIAEAEYLAVGKALGFTPERDPETFKRYNYELSMKLLGG